jgi:galactokinase
VTGTIAQYVPDLPPEGCVLELAMSFASNVPVGAGLSSSAALEVATAKFIEQFMKDNAFSSSKKDLDRTVERALRCQKAENEWAFSPCGIMDQMASSCALDGHMMLIDCTSYEIQQVPMKQEPKEKPVLLIIDSKVEHSIADGEYGLRRAQCNDALQAMQEVPLYHVLSLRDATLQDVETAKPKMDDISYKRAKHVVTENTRTKECKTAIKLGVWKRAGELINASHASLRDDFEVSCEEVDFLVDTCQKFDGVYGSRMTGGGFGGSTITLVQAEKVDALIEKVKADYKEKYDKECACFVTVPGPGARVLAIDMECMPH